MRSSARIRPLLYKLICLWEHYPDLQFGQLVINLARDLRRTDIWAAEDDEWEAVIDHAMFVAKTEDDMNETNYAGV
mgnify:CR=1 FL=1